MLQIRYVGFVFLLNHEKNNKELSKVIKDCDIMKGSYFEIGCVSEFKLLEFLS